ncbi:RNA polymerase factor sigma-54 [Roseococcus sp. SDR]|uniref:RNA polymerase factor sigma-54 n=1 Tax=Roseococcus sp. SDR TaxID=2835532 RepID=UPI001BD04AFB|nr:RNA polymerase factor sigma-54 [Roseococcus sp. SDR]MBS7793158.1 RNA polymerase factor sigma-54 [Roseococcus sp. SDR]MBV1848472.1 RNA polymerase factor sigma-54 [Roseococcus sp. SDR]
MALGPRLDLRHSQSLMMTPQLRQAIKLLQSSNLEVMAFVEEELERNPLLERDETHVAVAETIAAPADAAAVATSDTLAVGDAAPLDADFSNVMDEGEAYQPGMGAGGRMDFSDDLSGIEAMAAAGPTLRERLAEQIRLTFEEGRDRLIASALLAMVEPSGRLSLDAEALAARLGCEVAVVERVRRAMQRFEPTGMFCADLRECLQVQLEEAGRFDPYMARLLDNLPLLARRDMAALREACGVDAEDLAEMVAELRRLDPKPGAGGDDEPLSIIQPDVLMRADAEGGWILELNPETLPRVLVNRGFAARCTVGLKDKEQKGFLAEQLQSANWLVKSLEQRANTILKVASEIVRRQDAFFRHGVGHLRPLILRDVADEVEMHESTVSRVTANKYMATPRGMLELKYFFTTAIQGTAGGEAVSAEAVRHRIKGLVQAETYETVLSDDAIVLRLREEGVDIARRTVAKYREAMRIPSSVQRKREKAATA